MPFLSAISWLIAKIFSDNVLKFVAEKVLLTSLFVLVLPIVLNNFMYDIIDMIFTYMSSNTGTTNLSLNGSQTFTGMAGYLIAMMKIPECLSVLMSALIFKLILRHIPFLRF